MFAQIFRRLRINGGTSACTRVVLFSEPLPHYTTRAAAVPEHQKNRFLEEYLVNSLGFSKEEAFSASKKVSLKPFRKDPSLVIHFLVKQGFSKSQIKSIVSVLPGLLYYQPDKTLEPKLQFFRDLGLSGSEIVRLFMFQKHLFKSGLDFFRTRLAYVRILLGTDEKKVTRAVKRCSSLLRYDASEKVAAAAALLKNYGFSDKNVANFALRIPRRIFILEPENFEEMSCVVENDFGIPRGSPMFYYGFEVVSTIAKSTIDRKFDILRSFGWSDADVRTIDGKHPLRLRLSESKIREALNFFMKELGYTSNYLAYRPALITLCLEKRVKPRNEVVKVLNEKKLSKRSWNLYSFVTLPESKFVKDFLLPYKEEIPDVYRSYMEVVGGSKVQKV